MNLWHKYVPAASLSEALQALKSGEGTAYPIAGGTDLLLDLEQGHHPPAHTLVDLTTVAEMNLIEARTDRLFVGAAVPLSRIARDRLVIDHAAALVEACELIGGPQVRNVATLGGNVAHALPAADGTIGLLALDAMVELATLDGSRRIPLADLFLGPGKSALRQFEELIVGFDLLLKGANEGSAFRRVMRPQGVALPIVNTAIWIKSDGQVIRQVRVAVGPGGPTPWRARDAEQALAGRAMSPATARSALEALLEDVSFRSSPRRASSDYRRHLMGGLFEETLDLAWKRASGKDLPHGFSAS
jgi:xanthine dehydrogenase FAD-binding subunit